MPLTYADPPRIRVTMRATLTGNLPETVVTSIDGGSQGHPQVYNVTCNSAWRETGEWWAGESEKDFYRVHGDGGFAAIIGRNRETKEWHLYQLSD